MKKLRGVETALANFFASGVLALGPKLGPDDRALSPRMPTRPAGGRWRRPRRATSHTCACTGVARRGDVFVYFVYFDNDANGHAPHDAVALSSALVAKARRPDPS